MQEHNARFEAGEETWSRKVTPFYDHTMEEVAAILTSGLPAYDNTTAFATVAILETCFWQQRGVMFDDLSEQHIVDCALNHNYGKIQTEASYPYTAKDGNCSPASNGDFIYGSVTGQYNLWNTNEGDMKELVYINPVTA